MTLAEVVLQGLTVVETSVSLLIQLLVLLIGLCFQSTVIETLVDSQIRLTGFWVDLGFQWEGSM